MIELFVVRGIFVPVYLYRVLSALKTPRRSDVIPANLLFWTIVGVLVVISYRFGTNALPTEEAQTHLGVATAALLLGLLVLASQTQPLSQLIGVLRIENAIALFELSAGRAMPVRVQLGASAIFVITVLAFGWFLRRFGADESSWVEGPVL